MINLTVKGKSEQTEKVEPVITFSKDKILTAKKYANRKDILGELLEDGKDYSFEQVDGLINDYMKRKVN
jgi:hypothetical protein